VAASILSDPVHPIERLRYVARARGADAESLVRETAGALRGLGIDPSGLVVACRRIVERHPTCGPLWWLGARLLTSADPMAAARAAVAEIEADRTADALAGSLPEGATVATVGWPALTGQALVQRGDLRVLAVDAGHHGSSFVQRLERSDVDCELVPTEAAAVAAADAELVLVEADAVGAARVVAPVGSAVLAAVAGLTRTPVWLVAGCGRRLPGPMIDAIATRLGRDDVDYWSHDAELIPLASISHVVGPAGRLPVSAPAALCAECEVAPELLRSSPM
jgi:hypothetical protein